MNKNGKVEIPRIHFLIINMMSIQRKQYLGDSYNLITKMVQIVQYDQIFKKITDVSCKCLLDTGSMSTIISEKFCSLRG